MHPCMTSDKLQISVIPAQGKDSGTRRDTATRATHSCLPRTSGGASTPAVWTILKATWVYTSPCSFAMFSTSSVDMVADGERGGSGREPAARSKGSGKGGLLVRRSLVARRHLMS